MTETRSDARFPFDYRGELHMKWLIAAIVIAVYVFAYALMDASHKADKWQEENYGTQSKEDVRM